MGPPEFTGGNLRALTPTQYLSLRFNGAAGIHRRKLTDGKDESAGAAAASMGPPEFTGGNPARRPSRSPPSCLASMGPPEFTGGNGGGPQKREDLGLDASMGPPEFTGGNLFRKASDNSAINLLQWGRRNSPAETETGTRPGLHTPARFNGAAGIHRRKPGGDRSDPGHPGHASMGPPEFTGGNVVDGGHRRRSAARFNGAAGIHRRKQVAENALAVELIGFNGAAGIHRRKPRSPPTSRSLPAQLQWGRRNSPAETGLPPPL